MAKAQKKKAPKPESISGLLQQIDSQYGENSIIMGAEAIVDVDVFPSGIASLDRALGCGGVPQGRIMEIFGTESCGKTTLCLHIVASCQKHFFKEKGEEGRHGVAAFVDAEHAVDPTWAQLIGVDWDNLLFSQPDYGEQALQIAEKLAASGLVDLIVVDSVAALIPKAELEGEIGDHHVGAQARMMSQAMRKLYKEVNKNQCTLIFINQTREKIGVMFGDPTTTPGGKALKFAASVRIQVNKGSKINDGGEVQGFSPKAKIIKTKVGGKPFAEAEYFIYSGNPVSGIDTVQSFIDIGLEYNILTRKGNFISLDGKSLGNGIAKAAAALREDEETLNTLKNQIYAGLFDAIEEKKTRARDRRKIPQESTLDTSEILDDVD